MNKLSELSKPVAYTDADELRFNHATSDMWPIPLGFGKDAPLYSQEYVFALLAEMEAKDKRIAELENDEVRQRLANAEHQLHIAELANHNLRASRKAQFRKRNAAEAKLKEMTTFRDNAVKKNAQRWEELLALRAKLATPVRLPNESAASAMFDIFYQTERNNYRNVQLGFSDAKALGEWITKTLELRRAGFTVEGDEQ